MTPPRVAIITRTKDRPVFLKRAMRSVLEQSFQDWVHVIVNDGGATEPVDLLVSMEAEAYSGRIKVIHHDTSQGMQNASNAGLGACDSEYAVIHDDDDSWQPDFLDVCVDYLERQEEDSLTQGVVTQITQVLEELCVSGEIRDIRDLPYYPFTHVGIAEMRERNLFPPIAFLYRRKIHEKIGYFRQEFDVLGDHDFNLRFLRHYEIGVIPTFHANYHWRYGSQGNTVTRARDLHRTMLNRLQNAYGRELLDDPQGVPGDISSIEMPPPDGTEMVSFKKREKEPVAALPMPEFRKDYDFDILSLDVFDTALRRRCNRPKDVFKLLEDRACTELNLPAVPVALARVEAEKKARESIRPEVTLREIYEVMSDYTDLTGEQAMELMSLELEIEKELLYGDPRWVDAYNEFRKAGIRIMFVSDMYLECNIVTELLVLNGFPDPEVHVSCEYQCSKHDGKLQKAIVDKTGIEPGRILHVGDNYHSDCIRTWQAGWQAFHWSSEYNYTPWFAQVEPYYYCDEDLLSTRIMGEVDRLGNNLGNQDRSLMEQLGCEAAGPFYLSFLLWVLNEAKNDDVRKLILLGRDGYYWQKTFEVLAGKLDIGIQTEYVESSRKVLNFASFRTLDEEAIDFLLTPNPALTVADFVGRTGIDPKNHLLQMKQAGFEDPEMVLTTPMGGKFLVGNFSEQLKNLFLLLKPQLEEQFARDREGVERMLEQAEFDPIDCAIVDIGWNASSAQSLSRLYGLDAPNGLRAYYFGTWEKARKGRHPVRLKTFFIDYGRPRENAELVRESVNWIESLNAAPYPTLVAFREKEGVPEPLFSDKLRGGFSVGQQEEMWKGASSFLEAITDTLPANVGRCPGYGYLHLVLRRLLREPSMKEVDEWGDILHSEGYGIVSHTPLIRRINDNTFGDDLMRAYWASNWRKGFLTTLPEDKLQFVIERARPGRVRTVEQLESDLAWRQKQVDAFWNEKEEYKKEIAILQERISELVQRTNKLKTDLDWKSGEAHALYNDRQALQEKLDSMNRNSNRTENP